MYEHDAHGNSAADRDIIQVAVDVIVMAREAPMRILVTNDDGIYSPGIAALAEVVARFGEVRVVAPHVEMSSAAHAISASTPLSYTHTPMPFGDAYRVNGTPAVAATMSSARPNMSPEICAALASRT